MREIRSVPNTSAAAVLQKPKIDRRSARTRKALHGALMRLIVRKGYAAITVQDIIDEADIGRATFYAHVTGKDDLLRTGFAHLRTDLQAGIAASAGTAVPDAPLRFSLAMFEHAAEYANVYRTLLGDRGGTVAVQEIRRALAGAVAGEWQAIPGFAGIPKDLAISYVTESFVTVLHWWLIRKPELAPAEVNASFRQLVLGRC